jgi:cyclopropane fatty-acyl-phospholipid synthase-like methyltransferase
MSQEPTSQPHHDGAQGRHHDQDHDQEGMQHDFSDVEHWFDVFEGDNRNEWQQPEMLIELMAISPGMRVVDIGAGTGYFLSYLSGAVGEAGEVLALDVEPNLVEFMTERISREGLGNATAQLVAPDDPGLSADSIHRILIVNTWHHIGNRVDYSRLLLESLVDGGVVYVVDFTLESDEGPPVEFRLPPEVVLSELNEAGLLAELLPSTLTKQYVVLGRRPSR